MRQKIIVFNNVLITVVKYRALRSVTVIAKSKISYIS